MHHHHSSLNTSFTHRALLAAVILAGFTASQTILLAQGIGGGTRTANRTTGTASYPASTQMGTATVSVDPETRRVFVVTDAETAAYVEKVVKDLDRPTPQVLIKCVFLEATYTDDKDIGVQGIYSYTASGSSTPQFNGTGQVGTALNVASQAGGYYTFQSLAEGLDVTISALAKAGKTEILSRPSILARNNQPATISLGQQVPLITNTRFDNFGNQINSVTYENVGIILNVTPFITEDDYVEMLVAPQISQLTDRSQWVPISGGTNGANTVSAPVINSRSADTVVVVPNGQTVVIGGLMQNTKLDSTEKVPLLGDIPLLGFFFRHKVTSDAKTELMIFLTPHIVRQPGDLADLTGKERGKTKISSKAFSEEDLNRYLDDMPTVQEGDGK